MTTGNKFRSPREIAEAVIADRRSRMPIKVRATVAALSSIECVRREDEYRLVARARMALNNVRQKEFSSIKHELELMLAHYRAEQ